MRPSVILFDVNQTLSDMSPMGERFTEVGAPAHLAATWFAGLLRDGFALSTVGENPPFAELGIECLRQVLHGQPLTTDPASAVDHIMGSMAQLGVHPDVVPGIRSLAAAGFELATLTNGSASIADTLLTAAQVRDDFTALLSVEQAPAWKPASSAYTYAAEQLSTTPDRMMLVAVHPWDIHGASLAGLRTAWINRSGTSYPSTFVAPEHTVGSLVELADLLGNESLVGSGDV